MSSQYKAEVIDTIFINARLREVQPQLSPPFDGVGILAILEGAEEASLQAVVGGMVTICNPDGSEKCAKVAGLRKSLR